MSILLKAHDHNGRTAYANVEHGEQATSLTGDDEMSHTEERHERDPNNEHRVKRAKSERPL